MLLVSELLPRALLKPPVSGLCVVAGDEGWKPAEPAPFRPCCETSLDLPSKNFANRLTAYSDPLRSTGGVWLLAVGPVDGPDSGEAEASKVGGSEDGPRRKASEV